MTKVMAFFIGIFLFFGVIFAVFNTQKAYADLDCSTLKVSSTSAYKTCLENQLNQLEAELPPLLAQQAAQQKQTGTLKGDVDYLNSQINALKAKIKAAIFDFHIDCK